MRPRILVDWPQDHRNATPPMDRLRRVADVGVYGLRTDTDCRRDDTAEWIGGIQEVGLEPWPIVCGPRTLTNDVINWQARHADKLLSYGARVLTVENEPLISPGDEARISPDRYADLFRTIRKAVQDRAKLVLSAEMTIPVAQPIDYDGHGEPHVVRGTRTTYYDRVMAALDGWPTQAECRIDYIDVHSYHEPHSEDRCQHMTAPRWQFWRGMSRREQHRWYQRKARGVPIVWGETGSNLFRETEQEQAERYRRILDWAETLSIPYVGFYCHQAGSPESRRDFGLWNADWTEERPALQVLRDYCKRR